MSIVLAGIVLGYSLIVAIGPQNVLLIKQGIRREGITAVILVCALSAIVLVAACTAGVGVLVEKAPIALEILRWGGAAYLLWFAIRTFRDAIDPKSLHDSDESEAEAEAAGSRRHVVPAAGLRRAGAERAAVQAEGVALAQRRHRLHAAVHRRPPGVDVGISAPRDRNVHIVDTLAHPMRRAGCRRFIIGAMPGRSPAPAENTADNQRGMGQP